MINFTVMGKAVAKQRARTVFKNGRVWSFTPKNTKQWEEWIRLSALPHAPKKLITGAVEIHLAFWMSRSKSLPKEVVHHIKKPDCTNLFRAVEDALTGIIYKDDAQVIGIYGHKSYGDPPRVDIKIWEL